MEKILKNVGSRQTIFVQATPEELRKIANDMETMGKNSMPLEYVQAPLTPNITVIWKPEVSRMSFVRVSEHEEFKTAMANKAMEDSSESFSARTLPLHEVGSC